MTDKSKTPGDTPSLDEGQIETKRDVNRRTMLRGFGVGGLGLGAAAVVGCVPATTTTTTIVATRSGWTDADNGPIIDPAGNGRGPRTGRYTGWTDADNGPIVDPGGSGRGPQRR